MANWQTLVSIYRAAGNAYGTTYWDIDADTTELNDDYSKRIHITINGTDYYISKSITYIWGQTGSQGYGGCVVLVVKDTQGSGYIRERLIHSSSQYNYTTLLEPNYIENGLKVYIKTIEIGAESSFATGSVGGSLSTTTVTVNSDRIFTVDILEDYYALMELPTVTSNGGGATHIAKVTGQLKDLSSNLSDILMVSGGGGGGLLSGDTDYSGKEAGGISGSGDNSADQSTGNAFGQGESGTNVSGGGSGLYGGYKGTSAKSGGAGSGYIGNSLLSNKKMVGYNVPTSSAEGTKTESVNEVSASAVSGKPKIGNGFARIKFLRACWGGEEVPILWAGNSNKMTVQISNSSILFKLYTGDSVIYSFTAYAGSTIYDADNIYVGFLIDTNLELAKPSMIYDNNSVLSYNQEEPTEAQMGDIYTWISPGLPSE